jgi:hypothetical protein
MKILLRTFLLLWILLLLQAKAFSQSSSAQEEALQLFNEEKYSEALVKFKRLLTLFPNDPKYYYYNGVCLVMCNTSLQTALLYLNKAADKAVPRDVYFYIGKAYHYLYKFNDALEAYKKFQNYGTFEAKERLLCDMHIAMASCGININKYANIQVVEKEKVTLDNLFEILNQKIKSGKFIEKRNNLFAKGPAEPEDYRFEPFLAEQGAKIYESENSNGKKSNRNILILQKLSGKQWSKPENPGDNINSIFNEGFAYFNEAESALYFASKGHNSIGGYDIFKSTYDPDLKKWSEPINMGYPINSPYNDFLFIPDEEQNTAWFASDRETAGREIMLYRIKFEKKYSYSNLTKGFEFSNTLLVSSSPRVTEKKETTKNTNAEKHNTESSTKTASVSETSNKNIPKTKQKLSPEKEYPKELLNSDDYNRIVNGALTYQLKSDSVNRIVEDLREKYNNSNKEAEQSTLKTRMYQLTKQSAKYQVIADSLYILARNYEKKTGNSSKTESSPEVTNAMAKKAFANSKKTDEPAVQNKTKAKKSERPVIYEFKVLTKSPYKTTTDIPLDQPLPQGIIYKIQMGAFSQPVDPERFKGIVPISGETVNASGVKKYYAGLFNKMADAEKVLIKIKEYGFKDAYVVAFYDGKQVPSNRAIELEKDF